MKNKHQLQSEKTYQAFIDAIMKIIAEGDIEKFTKMCIRDRCREDGIPLLGRPALDLIVLPDVRF